MAKRGREESDEIRTEEAEDQGSFDSGREEDGEKLDVRCVQTEESVGLEEIEACGRGLCPGRGRDWDLDC